MQSIKVAAPAKINLTLEVMDKRHDGFHNIKSIMQAISLYDYLSFEIEESDKNKIILTGTSKEIPYNEKNLVHKAITAYFEKAKIEVNGEIVQVTPTEFRLLRQFISNSGKLLTYDVLLERLWDQGGQFVDKHALAVNVNRIRGKIEDGAHKYISNVYGMGYQWIG